jgi:hypothetical protein
MPPRVNPAPKRKRPVVQKKREQQRPAVNAATFPKQLNPLPFGSADLTQNVCCEQGPPMVVDYMTLKVHDRLPDDWGTARGAKRAAGPLTTAERYALLMGYVTVTVTDIGRDEVAALAEAYDVDDYLQEGFDEDGCFPLPQGTHRVHASHVDGSTHPPPVLWAVQARFRSRG